MLPRILFALLCACSPEEPPTSADLRTLVPFAQTTMVDLSQAEAEGSRKARLADGRIVLAPDGPLEADAACYVALPIRSTRPFRDLIVSWNVSTPAPSGFRVEVRVKSGTNAYSPWLFLGDWGQCPRIEKTLATEGAKIDTDFLRGQVTFDTAQVRVRGWSTGKAQDADLAIERLTLCFSDREARVPTSFVEEPRTPTRLPVPVRCQTVEESAIASRICSPTSLAMVLAYRGAIHTTAAVARAAFDPANDIYGNWPRNVQAAFSFGVPGYVTRITSFAEARALIQEGQPIIASIGVKPGQLRGAPYTKTEGHLIVITGFDAAGGVHVNDPAALDPDSAKLVYAREDLQTVWLDRGGTAYILLEKR